MRRSSGELMTVVWVGWLPLSLLCGVALGLLIGLAIGLYAVA